jgi:beta-N-acetylhexosaminidase
MSLGPLLIGLHGHELTARGSRVLSHPAVGGVVLFSRNYRDLPQLSRLIADIRSARDPRPLVCIDQEGGRVQRLRDGFTRLPALGALGSLYASNPGKALDLAYRHGRVMATEMLAVGIDLSFAPVLDLDRGSRVIGDRSLSGDPAVVTALGRAYLGGMHDSGMATTGKHFPGHGSVVADSHVDDVIDGRPLANIIESDVVPFRDLAEELDALMIAHVVYPEIDSQPAGYSRIWLRDILRGRLAYQGIVFSDDLGMHAAKTAGDLPDRVTACLDAGCDFALVCDPDEVEALLEGSDGFDGDASHLIARLYGRPTVDRDELLQAEREGIKEWGQWRASLERIARQTEEAPEWT